MSRGASARRSARRLLLAAVGLLLVSGLLPAGPATAHVFIKLDGDDSRSKLDLRSAAVSHTSTGVVHRVSTYNAWTPQSLQHDSFFVIQIDKNNDRIYERCAFIFYTNRLIGSLSNCRARFIRYLTVAKLSATAARVTIPKNETSGVYWWGAASIWDGPPPCARVCVDFAPNRFPDIRHDLTPPTITMDTGTLRIWESSTTSNFDFPFSISDAFGIKSWRVERHPYEATSWKVASSGTGAGTKNPIIAGIPGHSLYRVVAVDMQGNVRISPSRRVFVPRDDDELAPQGVYSGPTSVVMSSDAFLGSYTTLGIGEALVYNYVQTAGACRPFMLIGPGGGDWTVAVEMNGAPFTTVNGSASSGARQILFSHTVCDSTEFVFEVTGGTAEFGVDGVVSKATG